MSFSLKNIMDVLKLSGKEQGARSEVKEILQNIDPKYIEQKSEELIEKAHSTLKCIITLSL
jgi:hypothetical protein